MTNEYSEATWVLIQALSLTKSFILKWRLDEMLYEMILLQHHMVKI